MVHSFTFETNTPVNIMQESVLYSFLRQHWNADCHLLLQFHEGCLHVPCLLGHQTLFFISENIVDTVNANYKYDTLLNIMFDSNNKLWIHQLIYLSAIAQLYFCYPFPVLLC